MGREGKSKAEEEEEQKKRKRSLSSSPGAVRRGGDESAKRREKDKSKKSKKSHSKSSKRHHEKKSRDKHADSSHKHGAQAKFKLQELSSDDYFSKNNEFATWLKDEKGLFFSDLSSESSRDLFSEFVLCWNDYKLEPRYYEGIATGPRTSHKWNIKK